jgi:hypothetical protein
MPGHLYTPLPPEDRIEWAQDAFQELVLRKLDAIISLLAKDPPRPADDDERWITDGFGNYCDAICDQCGQSTMQVLRPGKFQCSECG